MTVAPDTPRLSFTGLVDATEALRERGLRLTTPRRLVLEALFAADGPVSAEYVAGRLKLELTSVYRNLETLEQHGLARHVHLGHGPGLYALVGRGEREFLSCERCGAVRTLTPDQLDPVRDQIKQRFGYEARFTHFAIVGLCPACAREPGAAARTATGSNGQTTNAAKHTREHPHGHEHSHGDHVHSLTPPLPSKGPPSTTRARPQGPMNTNALMLAGLSILLAGVIVRKAGDKTAAQRDPPSRRCRADRISRRRRRRAKVSAPNPLPRESSNGSAPEREDHKRRPHRWRPGAPGAHRPKRTIGRASNR